jgi:hypothetical protein
MKPILLVHGYSSEGKDKTVEEIYGNLPNELRQWFGEDAVRELDLSRWISLNDGICLDDVSFAMERALQAECADLLESGFHVVIHSTGALVVRNWIRLYSPKPCPIDNFVHLAGANFGSGLAHIGQGQLARWGRHISTGTGCGYRILNELEFGSWKTLDLHLHFLKAGNLMVEDYQVQEFCLIGSQIPKLQRVVPIRYVHEDSSDGTVRTSAGNLNFNYLNVLPTENALKLTCKELQQQTEKRCDNKQVSSVYYQIAQGSLTSDSNRTAIPYSILYEIAHSGKEIGIVSGKKNRAGLKTLMTKALNAPFDAQAYSQLAADFDGATEKVFARAAKLKASLTEWDPHSQYEGHTQLIFRIRDQQGTPVEHFDIYFKSSPTPKNTNALESMIEDRHNNKKDKGTITFYLRTQQFKKGSKNPWKNLLDQVAPLTLEITGEEPLSGDIAYVPLSVKLKPSEIQRMIRSFQTTVIDVTLARLPSANVFKIDRQQT